MPSSTTATSSTSPALARGRRALLTAGALGGLLLSSAVLSGCAARHIPNTDVEETTDNRRVVDFCEIYRKAVERKDIATLVTLASPDYYENGGNVDASDDLDYAGLEDYLKDQFQDVENIRYEIRYRRISHNEASIYVDYTYSGSYRQKKWRSTVEENRLELVPEGDSYRIVAGM